jgi:CRP/FNR family transcriptional regulator
MSLVKHIETSAKKIFFNVIARSPSPVVILSEAKNDSERRRTTKKFKLTKTPMLENLQILSKHPTFSSLTPAELKALCRYLLEEHFKKGDTVFWEGDAPQWLCLVKKGKVKILKHTAAGRDILLEVVPAGEIFGAVAVLDEKPYPATAAAMEPSTVLKLRRCDLVPLTAKNPNLVRELSIALGQRLRQAHNLARSLAAESVESRIAGLLIRLAEQRGLQAPDKKSVTIDVPLSRRDIADMAGTTIETAIRILSRFTKEGWIHTEGKRITLKDKKALLKAAGE